MQQILQDTSSGASFILTWLQIYDGNLELWCFFNVFLKLIYIGAIMAIKDKI